MMLLAELDLPWLRSLVVAVADFFSTSGHAVTLAEVRGLAGILLVSFSCGVLGSLVIGNRMAFFSDAMAHTAFASVALTLLTILIISGASTYRQAEPYLWMVPWSMCALGASVGVAIAFVREKTNLANDTVIGVFFALALGVAGLLLPALRQRVNIDLETILFGQLTLLSDFDLFSLMIAAALTAVVVMLRYNSFALTSFSPTLARSRGLPVRLNNYLFIVLLAVVVNLSIKAVGILLINALLVVPAAAAANAASNLRRVFWFTLAGSVLCGFFGFHWSKKIAIDTGAGEALRVGPTGMVVIVCVAWFFASIGVKLVRQRFFGASRIPAPCTADHGDGQFPHTH